MFVSEGRVYGCSKIFIGCIACCNRNKKPHRAMDAKDYQKTDSRAGFILLGRAKVAVPPASLEIRSYVYIYKRT